MTNFLAKTPLSFLPVEEVGIIFGYRKWVMDDVPKGTYDNRNYVAEVHDAPKATSDHEKE